MTHKKRQLVAQARPPRRRLPGTDDHSMHAQHHQVRAMNEHKHIPSYKDIMKEYQDRVASINFRNDMIQRQRNANYLNEYERLQGEMNHTILRGTRLATLRERKEKLMNLIKQDLQHGWGWG